MIRFFRQALVLLSPPTRRRFMVATVIMMIQAALEAVALAAIAPLMSILTAAHLRSTSRFVSDVGDILGHPTPAHLALFLGAFTVSLYLTKDVMAILTFRWAMTFSLREEADLVGRLARLYLYAPYREHLRTNSAEHVRTLTNSIRMIFQQGYVTAFVALGNSFSVLLIGVILVVVSPLTAIAAGFYFGMVGITYQRIVNRLVSRRVAKLHHDQAIDFRNIHQVMTGIKEIKVRGAEEMFTSEVHRLRVGLVPAYRTMALVQMTPRYVLELCMLGAATTIAAVAFATEPVTTATATLGLFIVGGFRLLAPLNSIIFGNAQAKAAIPSLQQIFHDLETMRSAEGPDFLQELTVKPADAAPVAAVDGGPPASVIVAAEPEDHSDELKPSIRLDRVCFSYQPGVPVLRDITFRIEPGESVGIVGGTGAGKSTLLDLLLGLLQPDSGRVLIGGRPLTSVRREWNRLIGYVPQSIALFDDTVRANVAFGDAGHVDDERVWEALRKAQLEDDVRRLAEGLDTPVGESATRLSGGQRQRLAVARALYRRPSVLMFDEATSSLDNETEFRLTEVLDNLQGSTTITIAHRLSTVRRCDRVLYLEHGQLVSEGTFSELTAQIPGFARMVELSSLSR